MSEFLSKFDGGEVIGLVAVSGTFLVGLVCGIVGIVAGPGGGSAATRRRRPSRRTCSTAACPRTTSAPSSTPGRRRPAGSGGTGYAPSTRRVIWGRRDSNPEPGDYESLALTVELRPRRVAFTGRRKRRSPPHLRRASAATACTTASVYFFVGGSSFTSILRTLTFELRVVLLDGEVALRVACSSSSTKSTVVLPLTLMMMWLPSAITSCVNHSSGLCGACSGRALLASLRLSRLKPGTGCRS